MKKDPHPFNPNMKALRRPLSKAERERKKAESNEKHASAMRKIDNIKLDDELKKELEDIGY